MTLHRQKTEIAREKYFSIDKIGTAAKKGRNDLTWYSCESSLVASAGRVTGGRSWCKDACRFRSIVDVARG